MRAFFVGALLLFLVGGGLFLRARNHADSIEPVVVNEGQATAGDVTVTYTDNGFSPKEVRIKKGQSVMWMNSASRTMWPATNRHPTHTAYPGSSIQQCETERANTLFDACKEIVTGGTYLFTFNEVGEWRYHDHVNAAKTGVIIVEE